MHHITKLNKEFYRCISLDLNCDDVIITDKQIAHIKAHHPNDYDSISPYFSYAIEYPDYILQANKPNTAIILKEIHANNTNIKLILRLVTSSEPSELKNSIITAMKINQKEWNRLLRNKTILYKRV